MRRNRPPGTARLRGGGVMQQWRNAYSALRSPNPPARITPSLQRPVTPSLRTVVPSPQPAPPAHELQGRIRAAAHGASETRRRLSIGIGGTLLVSYWIWLLTLPVPSDLFLRPAPWLMLLGFGAPFLAATLVAMPAAAAFRAHRRQALRRELEPIPRERLAAVLVPLRDDPSPDTRILVAPLIRELLAEGLEMAPAEGSSGSGAEVSAQTREP